MNNSFSNTVARSDGAKLGRVAELRAYLARFADRCTAARWLGPLCHVQVVQKIAAEAEAERAQVARDGYCAEQADLMAEKELAAAVDDLTDALKGGLDNTDGPRVRAATVRLQTARRHVCNSAMKDHAIAATA